MSRTPSSSQIAYRAESSEFKYEGPIDGRVASCKSWTRVKGVYNDRWNTPMAGAKINVWVNNVMVVCGKHLKDFEHLGLKPGKPPKTKEEKKLWEELGTYYYPNCENGTARFEIVQESENLDEIDSLRDSIQVRLDGAYRALEEKMSPYQKEWQTWGPLSIQIAIVQGFAEGSMDWLNEQKEIFSTKYWTDLGKSIEKGFWWTIDKAENALHGAEELLGEAWKNRGKVLDLSWWGEQNDKLWQSVYDAGTTAYDIAIEGIGFTKRSVQSAIEIINRREAILKLPDYIVTGDVDAIEQFIDSDLVAIDSQLAEELRYNKKWQGAIELIHDGESISIFAVYINLFITVVPPNFYAHAVGKAGLYIFIEVALVVILAMLGGAGAAARIGTLSARFAQLTMKTANVSRKIDKAKDALHAFTQMLDSFQEAIGDMETLRKKLLKSRRHKVKKGTTGATLKQKRETEKRDGKCRICGEKNHHTPVHRKGELDYV